MALSPTPESNSLNISHLLTALGISVSIIFALIGVIYHSWTKKVEDQQGQLDDGADAFTATAVSIAQLKSELQSVRDWLIAAERIIKELELKQLKDHDQLTTLQAEHKIRHERGDDK